RRCPRSPRFFLFARSPRPPTSPPFPYTTLFRSVERSARPRLQDGQGLPPLLGLSIRTLAGDRIEAVGHGHDPGRKGRHTAAGQRDRKSTRLNSSHDQISYAVFCLKKKKRMLRVT